MDVRARLTNEAIIDSGVWADNPDLRALASLFTVDPLVSSDPNGWHLSSSEIDAADLDPNRDTGALVREVLDRVNGAAAVILKGYRPAAWNGYLATPQREQKTISARYHVYAPRDFDALDPSSAATVLAAAAKDANLARVLALLGHLEPNWTWVDLWRVWEALRVRVGLDKFPGWVGDDQTRWNFSRSANDPAYGGPFARHDLYEENEKEKARTYTAMSPDDAVAFIKSLVVRWIEEESGSTLSLEADPAQ